MNDPKNSECKPKKALSILLFGSQITTGGAQRVLLDQASKFIEAGDQVQAVFYYDKDELLSDWKKKYSFQISVVSKYSRNGSKIVNLFHVFSGFHHLCSLIRSFKPDVIECFTHDANLIGIPAAWFCGVKCRVGTHHGQFIGLNGFKKKIHTALINSKMTSCLVCVSARAEKQALSEGVHFQKIRTIYNGIQSVNVNAELRKETRLLLGLDNQTKMVLNVGRLVPEKAQSLLIKAASEITLTNPDIYFFIAGDGPLHQNLEENIRKNNLEKKFILLGNRTDIGALLNAADLFVLYSATEGMPIALMEAMSAGVPLVASSLEGIQELVPDDTYGTLIPFGNPKLLSEAITLALSNSKKSRIQAENSQKRISELFSLDKSCESYRKIFLHFISNKC